MKIKSSLLIITLLSVLGISCRDSHKSQMSKDASIENPLKDELKIKSLFPDTVQQNKKYSGYIIYESPFDSVTKNMFGSKYNRRVILKLKPEPFYSVDKDFYDDSLSTNRFIAIDHQRMPYYGIFFSKTGVFKLDGKIEDSYLIKENYPDSVTEISKTLEFSKKIVVIK